MLTLMVGDRVRPMTYQRSFVRKDEAGHERTHTGGDATRRYAVRRNRTVAILPRAAIEVPSDLKRCTCGIMWAAPSGFVGTTAEGMKPDHHPGLHSREFLMRREEKPLQEPQAANRRNRPRPRSEA